MNLLLSGISHQWNALKQLRKKLKLRRQTRKSHCRRIVVGAGGRTSPGWIQTDIDQLNLLKQDDWERYFTENSIDILLAEHVWEHLSEDDGRRAAQNCFRFLKPGGYLRVAVPDGLHTDPDYIDWVRPHGFGPGADDHKVLYTHSTLRRLFEEAGFTVRLLEYFDEHGQFHFQEWDPAGGMVRRSKRFDHRNQDGKLRYSSLILDAVKWPAQDQTDKELVAAEISQSTGTRPRTKAA